MLDFAFRFFFHNRKRTFQAVFSLTLALTIYIATTLLVQAYSSNVSGMASIIKPSNRLIILENGKSLSESHISRDSVEILQQIQLSYPTIRVIVPQIYWPINITLGDTIIRSHLRLLNFTLFESLEKHNYLYDFREPNTGEVIIGQQLANMLSVGFGTKITISNSAHGFLTKVKVENILVSNKEEDIEILSTPSAVGLLNYSSYSFIELELTDSRQVPVLIKAIKSKILGVDVNVEKQTQNFIIYATNDVIRTVSLLELFFFVLMLISITYTMYTLVKESEEEIFILRSLGATRWNIIFLFIFQGILIGCISSILSLTLGYLGVEGIVSFVSFGVDLPYIALSLSRSLITNIFISSFILATLSSLYPAFVASKLKVVKEEWFRWI